MHIKTDILHGDAINENIINELGKESAIKFYDKYKKNCFGLDLEQLSRHMLILGSIGSGKTNLFNQIIDQLRNTVTQDDVVIIFDTKGDFYKEFYRPNDYVLSNSKEHKDVCQIWNIFKEIVLNCENEKEVAENTYELTSMLFRDAINKNQSQPFFVNAARDLMSVIIEEIIRLGKDDVEYRREYFNNQFLREYFSKLTIEEINNLLEGSKDQQVISSYIGTGNNDQGLGVLSEFQSVTRKLFMGEFSEKGLFSIREFIKQKGGRFLFIEYDLAVGNMLTPIYSLLFDLALKESLSRVTTKGNVYLIVDEFKLLPYLQYMSDGLNFGRSQGVKIIAGLQSVEQVYENYGTSQGKSMLAGFSTIASFRLNDLTSRNFITDMYGKNIVMDSYKKHNGDYISEKRFGNTVEDWDVNSLKLGEAIVGLPFQKPFRFHFDLYKR